jgi:hypothetical protein
MRKTKLLTWVSLLLFSSCDPIDAKLVVVNNSAIDIYFQTGSLHPDTTLDFGPFPIYKNGARVKNDDFNLLWSRYKIEE